MVVESVPLRPTPRPGAPEKSKGTPVVNNDRNDLQNVGMGVGKGEVESSILSGSTT